MMFVDSEVLHVIEHLPKVVGCAHINFFINYPLPYTTVQKLMVSKVFNMLERSL